MDHNYVIQNNLSAIYFNYINNITQSYRESCVTKLLSILSCHSINEREERKYLKPRPFPGTNEPARLIEKNDNEV